MSLKIAQFGLRLDVDDQPADADIEVLPNGLEAFNESRWPAGKVTLDRRLKLAPWRLHDLRRTFATRLHERLLIPAEIVESLLNHTVGGVRGVYDRSKHLESRRRALARWADCLLAIVEGEGREAPDNVVALKRLI